MPILAVLLVGLAALVVGAEELGLREEWVLTVAVGIGAPALLLVGAYAVGLKSLPEDLRLQPLEEGDVSPELSSAVADFEALGYERLGPPLLAMFPVTPTLVPMVHRQAGIFGVAYEVSAPRQRIVLDCVTFFEGEGRSLTSSTTPDAASLLAPVGRFFQILDSADAHELHSYHVDGIEFLRGAGLRSKSTSGATPEEIRSLMGQSVREYRRVLQAAPLRGTATAVWRALTKRNPHLRDVTSQPAARRQLQNLLGPLAGIDATPQRHTVLS